MTSLMASLPLHLLCQLISTGVPAVNNANIALSQPQQQFQPTTTTIPDGYVAYPKINVAYKIYSEELTWTEARERCNGLGARLAIIDSEKKVDSIASLRSSSGNGIYIGIYRMDNTWVDVSTGRTLSNIPWINSLNYPRSAQGNCARIQTVAPRGVWNEVCNAKLPYICEISLPSNHAQENQAVEISAN